MDDAREDAGLDRVTHTHSDTRQTELMHFHWGISVARVDASLNNNCIIKHVNENA